MTIKRIGFTSFKISTKGVDIITDPLLASEAGAVFNKTVGEVVLLTDAKYRGVDNILEKNKFSKITPSKRETLFEISASGEYEVGGVLIRRAIGSDFYVIDEGHIRIVYLGTVSHKVNIDDYSDLGDIDVLIAPVGDSDIFPNYDKLEKIINKLDPTYMIPCGYKEKGLISDFDGLKSVDDFIKNFGYTHVTNDKIFKITSGSEPENKVIEIVILE